MRACSSFALACLIATAPAAQQADPNPAWTYDPIGVGNVRAYQETGRPFARSRTDSPAAITLDGERWTIRRTQRFHRASDSDGWTRAESRELVRFDTAAANVRVWTSDGSERHLYPCRLDLPVPADNEATCGDADVPFTYSVALESAVEVGAETVSRSVRTLTTLGGTDELAAGIGLVTRAPDGSSSFSKLVYAVVDGDTLGAYPDDFPPTQIDPTPGWRYYPLAVGNEWEYERGNPLRVPPTVRTRRRVVGTSDIDGATYFDIELSTLNPDIGSWTVDGFDRLRYDTLSARVVDPEGESVSRCPFDEPQTEYSDDGLVYCVFSGDLDRFAAFVDTRMIETSGGVSVEVVSKQFEYVGIADGVATPVYLAGVGFYQMEGYYGGVPPFHRLTYASVRQEDGSVLEIGARFNVSAGEDAQAGPLAITAFPNPSAGPLALALDVPQAGDLTLEAFDALGRRVWTRDVAVSAGRHRVEVDAGDWAPGLYVVRATGGSASATATVVRR